MLRHQRRAVSTLQRQLAASASASATVAGNRFMSTTEPGTPKSLLTREEGVHQTMKVSRNWRNKPLFRRQGDVRFKDGTQATELLIREAKRRDSHEPEYIGSITDVMNCLTPIFDRNPKYAFAAKTLMEPERLIQFRVAWIDDMGVNRMNRAYRVQYSSTLGPYTGSMHFGSHVTNSVMKSLGFDTVFSNAVTGFPQGAAVGGSDFNPLDKSDAELQRFCQSYMTELVKYIGPDQDMPRMGMGVGDQEMGYLFGHYKRINMRTGTSDGRFMLSGDFPEAPGYGVVHFANAMLEDKGSSLKGKRCMIIGSGKVARSVAHKLMDYGAVPITLSDMSGHVYEPDGITKAKLNSIEQIKEERGALLGRYITASTSAQFNKPEDMLDIACDLCFPCGAMNIIDDRAVQKLADNGCEAVVEGGQGCVTAKARKTLKKRGMQYGPHTMTLTGPSIIHALGTEVSDQRLNEEVNRIYTEVKDTASEFNARGNLFAGANIAGFLRVANGMMMHGAV